MLTRDEKKTPFDFAERAPGKRQAQVDAIFADVATRYDLMNDLMSGGLHRAWKDALVTAVNPPKDAQPFAVVDVAGGTGDVALRIAAAAGAGTRCTVADINADMLGVGEARVRELGYDIDFVEANAEALPFADRSFDAVTIAFGIRNVPSIEVALAECRRVLRIGGRFLCMEFSNPDIPGFATLYELYASNVIPLLGRVVAHNEDAYRYLVESIGRFPAPPRFATMMRAAGFARCRFERMTGGIVTLYSGWRL
jgi:demethylmenaquinone methyltransferase / 2-methoxy-6-polyprenyl-1,4-benzoquinol methylase